MLSSVQGKRVPSSEREPREMKADVQAAPQRQTSKRDQELEFLNVISKFFPSPKHEQTPQNFNSNKQYKGKKTLHEYLTARQ